MSLIKYISRFFQKRKTIIQIENNESELKTIKQLDCIDTVWIKENDTIYEGWIFDISRRHITVVYDNGEKDYKFQIIKQLNNTQIEQDDKILYCNKP